MSTDRAISIIDHLAELRTRLLRSLACILFFFLCLTFYAGDIYELVATPLVSQFLPDSHMIATEVASTFFVPLKLVFYIALFLSVPFIFYQLWSFISPGLYENERHFALPLLIISIILFYAGIVFAYFLVFPLVFAFFIAIAPEGITVMTDISNYLDFILKIFLAFGIAFEVPIVTMMLVWSGVCNVDSLKKNRPYIILGAFVFGMVMTPPDILSQLLLALPVWLLFELGLYLSAFRIQRAVK